MSNTPATKHRRQPVDYTEGSITRSIIMMGGPSVLGFLASQIYTMVDTWWVAQLPQSHTAVAGMTIFNTLLWFFSAINSMVGSGSVAIISRRYGERDNHGTEMAIVETFVLKFFSALVFTLISIFFLRDLLYLSGARGESLRLGYEYGIVIMTGLPFAYMSFTVWTALRSVANPHMAMIIMLSSALLNVILDPILMFGWLGFPALGIRGAAIATIFAYFLTVVTGLVLFYGGYANIRLRWASTFRVRVESMWRLCKIGIPAWIAHGSEHGVRLALIPLLAGYGDPVIAAYGIGTQAVNLSGAFIAGIGLGLGALLGHTLGAGKKERARKTGDRAILVSVGIMTFLGVISYVGAPALARTFFTDQESITHTVEILRIFSLAFPFWGLWGMIDSVHSGVGKNMPGMIVNIIHGWGAVFPLFYYLTRITHAGSQALWFAMTACAAIMSVAYYFYYRRGAWLEEAI